MGLALRAEQGLKVRQPLNTLTINNKELASEFFGIIQDELNIKNVELVENNTDDKSLVWKEDGTIKIGLDVIITDELKKEGLLREIVRTINQIRKDQKLTISDRVSVKYNVKDELLKSVFVEYADEIKKSVLADVLVEGDGGEEKEIGGVVVGILVDKI
jgi:isoleucyl-tRNA synthetase